MNPELIGLLAGVIAFVQVVPYVISILRGKTKPERATYAIWSLVNIVVLLSYINSGATTTIWVALAYTASQLLVFGLSFRFGVGGLNRFDILCLVLAVIGIGVWVCTSDPVIALYTFIFVKALGLYPTLRKVYHRPDTENALSWSMCATASILNMFALTSFELSIVSLPLYALLADVAIALLVLFPRIRPAKVRNQRRDQYGYKI